MGCGYWLSVRIGRLALISTSTSTSTLTSRACSLGLRLTRLNLSRVNSTFDVDSFTSSRPLVLRFDFRSTRLSLPPSGVESTGGRSPVHSTQRQQQPAGRDDNHGRNLRLDNAAPTNDVDKIPSNRSLNKHATPTHYSHSFCDGTIQFERHRPVNCCPCPRGTYTAATAAAAVVSPHQPIRNLKLPPITEHQRCNFFSWRLFTITPHRIFAHSVCTLAPAVPVSADSLAAPTLGRGTVRDVRSRVPAIAT